MQNEINKNSTLTIITLLVLLCSSLTGHPVSTWILLGVVFPGFNLTITHPFALHSSINSLLSVSAGISQIVLTGTVCFLIHRSLILNYPSDTSPEYSYSTPIFLSIDEPTTHPPNYLSQKPQALYSCYFLGNSHLLRWLRAWALPRVRLSESWSYQQLL